MKQQQGFTLIELLVVIAIIGTLASVVLASLSSARAGARDAQRVAQMKEVEKALAVYFLDNGSYPPSGSVSLLHTAAAELVPNYISSLPLDPTHGGTVDGYRYQSTDSNRGYTILFRLETDSYGSWCGISDGSTQGWITTTWYRDLTHPDCS